VKTFDYPTCNQPISVTADLFGASSTLIRALKEERAGFLAEISILLALKSISFELGLGIVLSDCCGVFSREIASRVDSLRKLLAVVSVFVCAFSANGDTNQLLKLVSASDYGEIPASPWLAVSRKFSIELWIKPSFVAPSGSQTFVSQRRLDGGTGYAVGLSDGKMKFSMNDGLGNNFMGISETQLNVGIWYHLAAVYDGSLAELYVDGRKVKESAISLTLQETTFPVLIGREDAGGTRQAPGLYDEIRLWNKALTVEEIRFNMFVTLGGEPNLKGYWNFDDGTTKDASFNNNDAALRGNAMIQPDALLLLKATRAVELYFEPGLDFGSFQLQGKEADGEWFSMGAPIRGTGKELQFFDSVRSAPRRFYRLIRSE
jgi:hypothetical protein